MIVALPICSDCGIVLGPDAENPICDSCQAAVMVELFPEQFGSLLSEDPTEDTEDPFIPGDDAGAADPADLTCWCAT